MNKRGDLIDNVVLNYIIYFSFVLIFLIVGFYFVSAWNDGGAIYEDFYVKQIAMFANSAEIGQEIYLDVTAGTKVGFRNKIPVENMFVFDNANNRVFVKFSEGSGTNFYYLRNVDLIDYRLEAPSPDAGANVNRVYFRVVEKKKDV